MKRLTLLLAVFAVFSFLSACGQSGPLYVPGNPSQIAVPPEGGTTDDAAKEDQESDESPDKD
jgi:predicted small lipoprotein YifL